MQRREEFSINQLPTEQTALLSNDRPVKNSWWQNATQNLNLKKISGFIGVGILATTNALASATNALFMPSGEKPENLGSAWWHRMSPLTKTHSLINGLSSLTINTIMGVFFIPLAWNKFKNSIVHTFDSKQDAIDNSLSTFFALGAGIAQAAIAYAAFGYLGYLALLPATVIFAVTLANRYVSIKAIFQSIKNLFNPDIKIQTEFADALNHIKPEYLKEIELDFIRLCEEILKNHDSKESLSQAELENIAEHLAETLESLALSHPDILKEKTTKEYALHYAGLLFDIVLAVGVMAIPGGLTYLQKGFDGINTMAKLSGKNLLSLPLLAKHAIGALSGLATGLFFYDNGKKFRGIMLELIHHLHEHPKQIPFALLTLIGDGFSSASPQKVATGITEDPNNILGLKKDGAGTTFAILNALAGGVFLANSTIKKAFLPGGPKPEGLALKDMAHYFADATTHPVSHGTAIHFHRFLEQVRNTPSEANEEALPTPPYDTGYEISDLSIV